MIRNIMQEIGGIGIYGIASMMLFVIFFLGATLWAVLLGKPHIAHMSNLPLEADVTDLNEPLPKS